MQSIPYPTMLRIKIGQMLSEIFMFKSVDGRHTMYDVRRDPQMTKPFTISSPCEPLAQVS